MKEIVLATHNKHKRDELLAVLEREIGNSIRILTLDDLTPTIGDIPETGTTLEENAEIKARTVFELAGFPSLADDTGLEVDALHGAPGVYSARYAGDDATYNSNIDKLLGELKGKRSRSARFRTVIAFVDGDVTRFFDGEVSGSITEARRGTSGFGYDPVFQPHEHPESRTFAEMTSEEKNQISHRGRAVMKFVEYLKGMRDEGRGTRDEGRGTGE